MANASLKSYTPSRAGLIAGVAAAAAAAALWVHRKATVVERTHPPAGTMIEVDGVHLHCVERGSGTPVVLIHGNTVSLQDFEVAGLIDRLAQTHRVIAFDRPGFGHSDRPRDRLWTPAAQAELLHAALRRLNVDRAAVVGHSMGTMVALALALNHPAQVRQLVLLAGYYYPTVRYDALLVAPVALPIIGDAMRYTVTALAARAGLTPSVKAMFAPREVPSDFFGIMVREMMLRPSQLRANVEDAAFMMPAAASLSKRYAELRMPVSIMAGAADLVVDPEDHAVRLHRELNDSELAVMPGIGHMVHHAAQDLITAALAESGPGERGVAAETAQPVYS